MPDLHDPTLLAVLQNGATAHQARGAAERLRRKIARRSMPETLPEPGDTEPSLPELLRLAEAALNEVKRNGRNQVRVARAGSLMVPESTLPAPLNTLPLGALRRP